MTNIVSKSIIEEIEADPLSDNMMDFLIDRKKESPILDFKLTIRTEKNSDFPEIAKDVFAFSNYGGGWILIGWKEIKPNQFSPEGVPTDYSVDQASLQEKFNSYSNIKIHLRYTEFERTIDGSIRRFAAIYSPPSSNILKPIKIGKYMKGTKEKIVFRPGDIFYRRGTQSIFPNDLELGIIENRLSIDNYSISLLKGEPDNIDETLYSNLFPLIKIPTYIFSAFRKDYDNESIITLLKQNRLYPPRIFKFKIWEDKVVTFENLLDNENPYRNLVKVTSIRMEPIEKWISDINRNRILVELLNQEFIYHSMSLGLFYSKKDNKLYYPTHNKLKKIVWRSKERRSTRTVAAHMYAKQLNRNIYWHVAFSPSFLQLGIGKFFLEIMPTFLLTEDGIHQIRGSEEGTVITRLSYRNYNSSFLNNINFWIYQIKDGNEIKINNYLSISAEPLALKCPVGILFDIPSSEFSLDIDERDSVESPLGDDEYDF